MKEKLMYQRMLMIVMGIVMFLSNSNAQIEDFQVGTTTRKILAYAPSTIVPGRPLLISMHGYNQDIAYQRTQTQWEVIAKENNFVVVYPNGINNAWDISGTRDTDFILAIIDEMYKRYGIDRDRVYLSGFSMGGMMTYYAASKIADKIAAFGPVSGAGGTTANSSRPVPIIHVHGTTDDVASYSTVAPCLNAWIARNNCPTTAQVTTPYPAGSTKGDSKSYWGPGDDSVAVALISLAGKGHWHSIEEGGVNTSQEIWDFCKNFSLGYGVSKYKAASVNDANPNQIHVTFTKPLKELTDIEGFAVKVDGLNADIDTVIMTDSLNLTVLLMNNILKNNEVYLSYNDGNVLSVYEKPLPNFNDTLVDNQLFGSSPKFVELKMSDHGDTLIAKFNKKMLLPLNIDSLDLMADYNGEMNIPIIECIFLNNDSTTLVFPLGDTVYADYELVLNYTGNNIVASDSGLLKTFTDYKVTNNSMGLPVQITAASLHESAIAISLEFPKPMYMTDSQIDQITLKVNGEEVAIKEVFNILNTIRLNLFSNLRYGDVITVTYTPGDITAKDKGPLDDFTDFPVVNTISEPAYTQIPGKVEAENYVMQYGTDTETTSDAGGGLNVGWLDADDWMVYAIENNSDSTNFKINFRLATQNSGTKFDYYLDDVKIGQIAVPNTGGWQVFTSVITDITITKGKHYFKIVIVGGPFNINYFDIQYTFTSASKSILQNIGVYPNPTAGELVIESPDFQYKNIEILDITGRIVYSSTLDWEPEMRLQTTLNNGSYLIRLSNDKESQIQRIIVVK